MSQTDLEKCPGGILLRLVEFVSLAFW
eukprot:SAG11_NODE_6865_length_1234_cov_0.728634_1_plen_26_part_10